MRPQGSLSPPLIIRMGLRATFSPDGTRILTASADQTAKLWDAASGKLIAFFNHQDEVKDAAFSPDGTRILTASRDKTAKLWDAVLGKPISSLVHQDAVENAAFSANGARILTATTDHSVKLWDAASGKLIASFENLALNIAVGLFHAAFSPDGTRVVTATRKSQCRSLGCGFGQTSRLLCPSG